MANNMKNEFEQYIREMTETISKEIYLADLKKICENYMDQLENCKILYEKSAKVEKGVLTSVAANAKQIQAIKEDMDQKHEQLKEEVEKYHKEYKNIMDSYAKDVNEVNASTKEKFFQEFNGKVEDITLSLKDTLTDCNASLEKTLNQTITKENLDEYITKMDESTARIKEGLHVLDSGYEDVFAEYTKQVRLVGEDERTRFHSIVKEQVENALKEFSDTMEAAVKEQKSMLDSKMIDNQMLEQMADNVKVIGGKIDQIQEDNDKKFEVLLQRLEHEKRRNDKLGQEQSKQMRAISYLTISNVVIFLLSILVICALKPWQSQVLGTVVTGIYIAVVVAYAVISCLLKNSKYPNVQEEEIETEGEMDEDGR